MNNAFSDISANAVTSPNQPTGFGDANSAGVAGQQSNTSISGGDSPSPVANLAQGVGGILLFPGRMIVQQFVGTGDPLDTSHLPITVLLSAAIWYGAYWYLFERSKKKVSE